MTGFSCGLMCTWEGMLVAFTLGFAKLVDAEGRQVLASSHGNSITDISAAVDPPASFTAFLLLG